MTVRAFFRAATISSAKPPYDTLHLKIFYPADLSANQPNSRSGDAPANSQLAPFPVVIFFSGINCNSERYQWLAVELAQQGLVVVLFTWVSEYLPGNTGLTPGTDLSQTTPDTYGTAATALALPTLLAELERLQTEGVLAGLLNLEQIILGGHSAGGRLALENANPQFYPQVTAAFAYGAHTAAATMLGFPPNTILPLSGGRSLLLMGGTCDGVIAANSGYYGMPAGDPTGAILRTFHEALSGGREDAYLVLVEGANHFAMVDPLDTTIAQAVNDLPTTHPVADIRAFMAKTIGLFIAAHVQQNAPALQELQQHSSHPLVAQFERK